MSSWAAWKNIDTDWVFQKSSTPISTQTSEDLSTAALNVTSTDMVTSLDFWVSDLQGGGEMKTGAETHGWTRTRQGHRDRVAERGGEKGFL